MAKKHLGAQSELLAANYLLDKGYDVFRNVSSSGPGDLIALDTRTGQIRIIDAKSGTRYKSGACNPTVKILNDRQRRLGVELLVVLPSGEVVENPTSSLDEKVPDVVVARECKDKILQLRSEGKTLQEVAAHLNLGLSAVSEVSATLNVRKKDKTCIFN